MLDCDDGNTMAGDGCSATCRVEVPPACGDGTRDRGEECDDGNTRSGDGCDDGCFFELGPCDPTPTTRDASARADAACTDVGPAVPPDAAIDAGPDVPVLEGGGCACRASGARDQRSRGVTLVLAAVLVLLVRRRAGMCCR
jgi:MYXO-CTERM domain-containing protein